MPITIIGVTRDKNHRQKIILGRHKKASLFICVKILSRYTLLLMTSSAEDKCLDIRAKVRLNGKELQGNALHSPGWAALRAAQAVSGQGRPCNSISGEWSNYLVTGPWLVMTDGKHMWHVTWLWLKSEGQRWTAVDTLIKSIHLNICSARLKSEIPEYRLKQIKIYVASSRVQNIIVSCYAPGAGASVHWPGSWDRNPRPGPVINHWQSAAW